MGMKIKWLKEVGLQVVEGFIDKEANEIKVLYNHAEEACKSEKEILVQGKLRAQIVKLGDIGEDRPAFEKIIVRKYEKFREKHYCSLLTLEELDFKVLRHVVPWFKKLAGVLLCRRANASGTHERDLGIVAGFLHGKCYTCSNNTTTQKCRRCKLTAQVCTNTYLKKILRDETVENTSDFKERITAGYDAYFEVTSNWINNKINLNPTTKRLASFDEKARGKTTRAPGGFRSRFEDSDNGTGSMSPTYNGGGSTSPGTYNGAVYESSFGTDTSGGQVST